MSKKLVQINVVCNGSTGRIMEQIQKNAIDNGWEAYSFYGRGKPSNSHCIKIGNKLDVLCHVLLTRVFDIHGHGSKRATKKLIKKIEKINPDVIQLHNIHGYYLNIEVLFKYLKRCNKKIIWTLHDCWAFTGHCTHFTYPKCEKWKNGCNKCERKKEYPASLVKDNSEKEYKIKKKLFTEINNLTLVTPSNWLANLVEKSFLSKYPLEIINNGIDTKVFKPIRTKNIIEKYNIDNTKKIILGVAAIWNEKKGLEEFKRLAQKNFEDIIIILVGLNKKQIKEMPKNIIGIERTENLEELANLYTIADVLYNPSKEETFSMVTVEALACGTPVIVYDNSAVKEIINENNGICLKIDDKNKEEKIKEFIKSKPNINMDLEKISIESMNQKYLELYDK